MSGGICAVYGCYNATVRNCSKSFFRFPLNKEMCKQWLVKCKRSDLDETFKVKGVECLNRNYRVCSDHFAETDFKNRKMFSQGLIKGAIPSKNLHGTELKTRKSPVKRKLFQKEAPVAEVVTEVPICCTGPKKRKVVQCDSLDSVRKKLRLLQKYKSRYCATIAHLKQKVVFLQKNNKDLVSKLAQLKSDNSIMTPLVDVKCKPRGRRFSDLQKNFALALYYCSAKCYRLLRKYYSLPTVRSLRSWLQNLHVYPGLNKNVLNLLNVKTTALEKKERLVSIVIDEMSLKESIAYHSPSDLFEGFVDFGEILHKAKVFDKTDNTWTKCNQVLAIVVRGIYRNYKQVIGYYLSKEAISGTVLKEILLYTLNKIQEIGLIPKTVVCDQGSNNLKMRKLLAVSCKKPFIVINGEKVYFFHDPPHLLKSVRNNLKKYDITNGLKTFRWCHIETFYLKDSAMTPRLAPSLTKKCIQLPPFSSMRVCFAAKVLSHSVSVGILTHVAFNSMPPECASTAEFISVFDTLFDIFNSSQRRTAKEFNCAISENSGHLKKLEEILEFLRSLKVLNSRGTNPPCLLGWIENIASLKLLLSDLTSNYNFQYLLTRRLTQDCIENLFSVLRAKGGNNITPDAATFRCSLRSAMTNQLLVPSDSSNCQLDAAQFMLKRKEIIKNKLSPNITIFLPEVKETENSLKGTSENYVVGWALSKLPHKTCQNVLCSEESYAEPRNVHIALKQYDNAKLLFPNAVASGLCRQINEYFENYFENLLKDSSVGVRTKLANTIANNIETVGVCTYCQNLVINKYINVLIKCWLQKQNDNATKCKTKNKKAKKILHE